ncbi:hypothetical protein KEM54_006044 [Ascosphaera aggregata]|nr:hypothetical protein KEM54_006044 [Ascosphaera aggregata]
MAQTSGQTSSLEDNNSLRRDGDDKQKSKRPKTEACMTSKVQEVVIDYSDCSKSAPLAPKSSSIPSSKVHTSFKNNQAREQAFWWREEDVPVTFKSGTKAEITRCSLQFTLPNDLDSPVFMYYKLTNFYQNHRRYVKSLDQEQLEGKPLRNKTIDGGFCDPLRLDPETGKAYYPCGLIANSLFNDTIYEPVRLGVNKNETYPMTNKGIAWSSDKDLIKPTKYKWYEVAPPPNWRQMYPQGYTAEQPPPNLQEDEGFQVWMRTAGLPTFSKMARRNDKTVMKAGTYRIDIDDLFPVSAFDGTKSVVLTTRTIMGGKNPFMGIAYVVVGGICIVFGAVFTIAHLIKPRRLGDHTYLSWNSEQPTSGMATGSDCFAT